MMETHAARKTGASWKILLLLAAFAATDGIPRLANLIAGSLAVYFTALDPDNVFVFSFLHHIVQGLAALALIVIASLIFKRPLRQFGFNMNNWQWSLRTVGRFCVGWVVLYTLGALLMTPSGMKPAYPMNLRNAAGYSLFMLTMPGPSEETLFRALPYFILGFAWTGSVKVFKLRLSHIAIITAVLFTVAHIGFTYVPFGITYIQPMQLAFAMGLGLFYGYMYDKTGSLLGPVLAHAASDFLGNLIVILLMLVR